MAIGTECIYLYTYDFFVKFTLLCFSLYIKRDITIIIGTVT